eukprot:29528-Chlamydomonas_euryale.AAC.5
MPAPVGRIPASVRHRTIETSCLRPRGQSPTSTRHRPSGGPCRGGGRTYRRTRARQHRRARKAQSACARCTQRARTCLTISHSQRTTGVPAW